jgi:putative tricarboxylic transport membrane protein
MKTSRALLALLGLLSLVMLAPAGVPAAELPCRAVKFIIPWAAGGDTDIIMRTVVNGAQQELGKDIVVVNIGGQGGNKGAKEAKDAKPDGCTLFSGHDSMQTSYLSGRVDFNYFGLEPIALLTHTPSIVAGHKDVPFNNMRDLVAAAKKAPGTILYGATLGSTSHFFPLQIEDAAGVKFKYVPYDGTRERMTALLAHNIELGELNIISAQQYLKEGSLKSLGIATEKRDPRLPDLPTLKEQGIDVIYGVNRGVFAPKGTPADIIALYENVFHRAVQRPEVVSAIEGNGTSIEFKGHKDYIAFLENDAKVTEKIAMAVGLKK